MSAATEMRSTIVALAAALALTAPVAPATAAVGGFRLPPAQSDRQPPPDRQGPVAPDVPESRRAAPAPSPSPSPSATQSPSAPTIIPPQIALPSASAATPGAAPRREAPASARAGAPAPAVSTSLGVAPSATPAPAPASATQATPAAVAPATRPAESTGSIWPWLAAGMALLASFALAGWVWLRRRQGFGPVAVPEIERPRVASEPASPPLAPAGPAPAPAPAAVLSGEPLQVSLEPLRLSLTLMNATLAYRLEIVNRGLHPLTALAIGADMISAHASMTPEEQLSGPGNAAGALQRIERLEPGESRVVEGEFRLPFGQIVPIRQGNAALLLPLARFRVEAEGARPVVRTFAVGQPGVGSALQPFRLDQGPRVYPRLTHHAFA